MFRHHFTRDVRRDPNPYITLDARPGPRQRVSYHKPETRFVASLSIDQNRRDANFKDMGRYQQRQITNRVCFVPDRSRPRYPVRSTQRTLDLQNVPPINGLWTDRLQSQHSRTKSIVQIERNLQRRSNTESVQMIEMRRKQPSEPAYLPRSGPITNKLTQSIYYIEN